LALQSSAARRRRATPRARPVGPPGPGRRGNPATVGSPALAPTFTHPIRPGHAPHAHGLRGTDLRRQPTATPPYVRRAAPALPLAVTARHRLVVPALDVCDGRDPPRQGTLLIKAQPSFLARAPEPRRGRHCRRR
jgi:hypothetical protein